MSLAEIVNNTDTIHMHDGAFPYPPSESTGITGNTLCGIVFVWGDKFEVLVLTTNPANVTCDVCKFTMATAGNTINQNTGRVHPAPSHHSP